MMLMMMGCSGCYGWIVIKKDLKPARRKDVDSEDGSDDEDDLLDIKKQKNMMKLILVKLVLWLMILRPQLELMDQMMKCMILSDEDMDDDDDDDIEECRSANIHHLWCLARLTSRFASLSMDCAHPSTLVSSNKLPARSSNNFFRCPTISFLWFRLSLRTHYFFDLSIHYWGVIVWFYNVVYPLYKRHMHS